MTDAGYAVARELAIEPVVFPGGHNGFLGGEYGQTGKPEEFASLIEKDMSKWPALVEQAGARQK